MAEPLTTVLALAILVCRAHGMTGCAACDGIPGAHDLVQGCPLCLRPASECQGHFASPTVDTGPTCFRCGRPLAGHIAPVGHCRVSVVPAHAVSDEVVPLIQPCTTHALPHFSCRRCFASTLEALVSALAERDRLAESVGLLTQAREALTRAHDQVVNALQDELARMGLALDAELRRRCELEQHNAVLEASLADETAARVAAQQALQRGAA